MASYAALLSLLHTLNQIENHPRPPISLDQEQLRSLTQNLTFFQDFFESYSCEENDELESHIAALANSAEDVIESHIVDQIHAGSTNHGENIQSFDLHQCLERVIVDMDLIKKEAIESINKEKIKRSQHHLLHTNSFVPTTSVGRSSAGQSSTMARFDDVLVNKVLNKLIGQRCRLQIIPIVGMGGIGKTTLAQNIYTKPLIEQHFDIRYWVTISQEYSRINILQVLCPDSKASNDDLMSEDELGEKVYKKLCGMRYLIVMDDMWSIEAFDEVKSFFPNNNNGSRIMVTTRLSNLAFQLSRSHVFQMQFLDVDKSWDLLRETVFGKLYCPDELEKIGKEIARHCSGLPLSIVVVGGLLKNSNMTQSQWEYTLQNLNSLVNLEDDEYCLQILRRSYKELPIHLKPCFLYMGVYPEDSEIIVSELIKLWVSEGILKPNDDKSLEEVAKEYLNELICRNLILVAELQWNGEAKICKIHDLLRDVSLQEAKKQKFLGVVRQQKHHTLLGINMERRMCIDLQNASEEYSPEFICAMESASLNRSLLYTKRAYCFGDSPSLHFKLLRVYSSVDNYHGTTTYSNNAIFEHANLRYLSLRPYRDAVSSLPSLFSILWNLQTLKFDCLYYYDRTVPSEIWEMPLLRHVMLGGFSLPDPPDEENTCVLENLQTLSGIRNFKFSDEAVSRIPNVKKLEVEYEGFGFDRRVLNFNNLKNLGSLQKLESFSLKAHVLLNSRARENICSNLVSFPHSLKKLTLEGIKLNWEDLKISIGSLPFLEVLILNLGACMGPKWETVEGQFCCLRVLKIEYCIGLKYWDTDSSHFPRLEHLFFNHFKELEGIPLSIGDIPTLKSIELVHCSKSAENSAKRIKEEQQENGNEDLRVTIVHDLDEEYQVDSVEEDEVDSKEDEVDSMKKI